MQENVQGPYSQRKKLKSGLRVFLSVFAYILSTQDISRTGPNFYSVRLNISLRIRA